MTVTIHESLHVITGLQPLGGPRVITNSELEFLEERVDFSRPRQDDFPRRKVF